MILFFISSIIGYIEMNKTYKNKKFLYLILNILLLFTYNIFPHIIFSITPLILSQVFIDFKDLELSDINNLSLFIISLIYSIQNKNLEWKSFIILTTIYLVIFLFPINTIGFGDVKLIASISLLIPLKEITMHLFYPFLIAIFVGILYKIIKKQDEFPMGPCILIYFLINFL